jgi:hypothetical protein
MPNSGVGWELHVVRMEQQARKYRPPKIGSDALTCGFRCDPFSIGTRSGEQRLDFTELLPQLCFFRHRGLVINLALARASITRALRQQIR